MRGADSLRHVFAPEQGQRDTLADRKFHVHLFRPAEQHRKTQCVTVERETGGEIIDKQANIEKFHSGAPLNWEDCEWKDGKLDREGRAEE